MNMPGPMELMAIALVAMIVFGPRRMPEIGRSVGQALREFRRSSQEVMDTIQGAIEAEDPPRAPQRKAAPADRPVPEEED